MNGTAKKSSIQPTQTSENLMLSNAYTPGGGHALGKKTSVSRSIVLYLIMRS